MALGGAVITGKVWRGFAIAASRLGVSCDHYRPTNPMAPITSASRRGSLYAAFDPSPTFAFSAAPDRDRETRATLVDGALVQVGDYLIGSAGSFFIASREPLLPIQAVACNATVAVFRLGGPDQVGPVDYSYDTTTSEAALLQGWPASLRMRGGGGIGGTDIPGAPSDPNLTLLLPRLPGALVINTGDAVKDALDRRMVVTAAERTPHGWRCVTRLVAGG